MGGSACWQFYRDCLNDVSHETPIFYNEEIMRIKTIKLWPNYFLALLLVTAFPTMQSGTAHIHLGDQHYHDENQHRHHTEIHAHNLINQTTVIADIHQKSHVSVIVLIDECSISNQEKQKNLSVVLIAESANLLQPLLLTSTKIPVSEDTRSRYLNRSTLNPRAPPQIS